MSYRVVIIGAMLASSALLFGQDCESVVADDAHVLGGNVALVQQAAERLKSTGQDVYVRTFMDFGGASNVEAFTRQLAGQCPSWQNAGGGYKSNLVAMVLVVGKRKVNIGAGESVDMIVPQSARTRILAQKAAPLFRDGDWAGGFAATLNELKRVIDDSQVRSVPLPSTSAPPQPVAPPAPEKPMDLSGLWMFLKWVAGLCVAGLLFVFARKRYQEIQDVKQARAKTVEAKQSAATRMTELPETYEFLLARVNLLLRQTQTDRASKLVQKVEAQKKIMDGAVGEFGSLAGDLDIAKSTSLDDLEQARKGYQNIVETLQRASVEFSSIEARVGDYEQEIKQAPVQIAQLRSSVQNARTDIANVAVHGYRVEGYLANLDAALQAADQADSLLKACKFDECNNQLAAGEKLVRQALSAVNLPKTEADLLTHITSCEDRARQIRQQILDSKAIFDRMQAQFAERSWSSIRGNGSQATTLLNWCAQALPQARTALGRDVQDWQRATELVNQAHQNLDQATVLVQAIGTMEKDLLTAQAAAKHDVAKAEAALVQAEQYERVHDDDITDEVKPELAGARKKLVQAQTELSQSKPEYFLVIKLAKEVHGKADETLAFCRNEYEAAERLRSKAETALRDARTRVSSARQYYNSHKRHATGKQTSLLNDAETWLANAETAALPAERLRWAEKADDSGEKAYKGVRKLVQEAEESSYRTTTYGSPSYSSSNTAVIVGNMGWGGSSGSSSSSSSSSDSSWNFGSSSSGSDSSISIDFGSFGGGSDSSVGF